MSDDLGVLIISGQGAKISADVRPPSSKALGALSNALHAVYKTNPIFTHYELAQGFILHFGAGGFKQNPRLEFSNLMLAQYVHANLDLGF